MHRASFRFVVRCDVVLRGTMRSLAFFWWTVRCAGQRMCCWTVKGSESQPHDSDGCGRSLPLVICITLPSSHACHTTNQQALTHTMAGAP